MRIKSVAIAATLVTVLAGCGANTQDSGNAGSTEFKRGGTLTIPVESANLDLDPAKSSNLAITTQSLFNRRLTTWSSEPGKPVVPVPDLATDTGTTTDGGQTWKYTLKPGLKFEDGTPVTSGDVKYGLERSFAPLLAGGFNYHKQFLVGGDNYAGPYDGKHLDSIETPDDSTLVFKLTQAFGDWPWIVSQPAFAPVPKAKDNPQTYGRAPVATGPYRIADRADGQVVLERNPHWDPSTDPNRTAGPDKVIFKLGVSKETSVQSVIHGSGDGRFSFAGPVPASQLAALTANPSAKSRTAEAGGGSIDQVAINTAKPLLADLRVRQAINLATDKASYLVASGGKNRGSIATTNIPPALEGYEKFDVLPAPETGDVEKAKTLLAEAGHANGVDLVLVHQNSAEVVAQAQALQAGWQRAGIRVTLRTVDRPTYTDITMHQDGSGYDLALSRWQADFPSPYSMLQPSFSSKEIGRGGYNAARLSDPTVDAAIDNAARQVDPAAAKAAWAKADRAITALAPNVPLINSVNTWIYGAGVANFLVPPFPSYPNYFRISLLP
ncbi:ABC transporter substrate-binding protein [Nocardia sp. NPDC058666]|uniref:ABC transporter substrate-binding protein n=1 Tax=Nocardia sp. NPDC058666 TaxID=3346587 RepID=UPI003659A960